MGKNKGKGKNKATASGSASGDDSGSGDDSVLYSKNTSGKINIDDFDLIKVVGKGSFGKVMQVRKKDTGQLYALKILKKSMLIERNQIEHTMSERNIMQSLQHPFVVSLHFAWQTPEKLYLALEYVNGGELYTHLKNEGRFSEERVQLYVAELACVIGHLHSFEIVYRTSSPRTSCWMLTGTSRLQTLGFPSSSRRPTRRQRRSAGRPSTWRPRSCRGRGTARQSIGGPWGRSTTRCSLRSLPFTHKTPRSCTRGSWGGR